MPRNRKCIIHNSLVEVCFRTEEGLPFVATPYMRVIMTSVLAAAQNMFPVTICHGVLMPNHVHLLLVVKDPEDFKDFICYVKRESAHGINRLLGRKKHTVWCDRYDSPPILDYISAIKRIIYLYTNPQKANLVERIEDYPNLSTWSAFVSGGTELTVGRVARASIPTIPNRALSFKEQDNLAEILKEEAFAEQSLIIEPDAWMRCFPVLDDKSPKDINELIFRVIRKHEKRHSRKRLNDGVKVLGVQALRSQNIRKVYFPKKHGLKMICLSSIKALRVAFIKWFKEETDSFREEDERPISPIPRQHNIKDWVSSIPPGFFAPGGKLFANLNPFLVPGIGFGV